MFCCLCSTYVLSLYFQLMFCYVCCWCFVMFVAYVFIWRYVFCWCFVVKFADYLSSLCLLPMFCFFLLIFIFSKVFLLCLLLIFSCYYYICLGRVAKFTLMFCLLILCYVCCCFIMSATYGVFVVVVYRECSRCYYHNHHLHRHQKQ